MIHLLFEDKLNMNPIKEAVETHSLNLVFFWYFLSSSELLASPMVSSWFSSILWAIDIP